MWTGKTNGQNIAEKKRRRYALLLNVLGEINIKFNEYKVLTCMIYQLFG
jgi:hypothetical protein